MYIQNVCIYSVHVRLQYAARVFADIPVVLAGLQVLRKLELFCGGGGLSYMAQSGQGVQITGCWANDINASACSTYICNRPHVFVSSGCDLAVVCVLP